MAQSANTYGGCSLSTLSSLVSLPQLANSFSQVRGSYTLMLLCWQGANLGDVL